MKRSGIDTELTLTPLASATPMGIMEETNNLIVVEDSRRSRLSNASSADEDP